jgi:PAS domain S-box-containing protein
MAEKKIGEKADATDIEKSAPLPYTDSEWKSDESLHLVYANENLLKKWNLQMHEAAGKNVKDLGYDSEATRAIAEASKRALQGEEVSDEKWFTYADGTRRRIRFTIKPRLENGNVVGVHGRSRDLTHTAYTDETLRQSHDNLISVLEGMNDAFCAFDQQWNFVRVNAVYEKIFGKPRGQLIGRNLWEVFSTSISEHYFKEYHRVMKDRVSISFDSHYEGFDLWTTSNAFPTDDGGIAIFLKDTTIQKKAELQAIKDAENLRAALAVRDEFLSIASHELRTPLTSLKLLMEVTKRKSAAGLNSDAFAEAYEKFVKVSDRQIDRLIELVNDLLDVTRISSSKLEFNLAPMQLSDLIDEVIENYSEALEQARCKVTVLGKKSQMVNWDHSRIEQVFVNFFSNAIKYAPASPIEIQIARSGDDIVIEFKDSGAGIPADRVPHVFERYERASSRNISGLGLGLYIVKQIVEGHGGAITVRSTEGRGTTFTLVIPVGI